MKTETLINAVEQNDFAFFAAMMVLQLLFTLFVMPATRGRSLESLAEGLAKKAPTAA